MLKPIIVMWNEWNENQIVHLKLADPNNAESDY